MTADPMEIVRLSLTDLPEAGTVLDAAFGRSGMTNNLRAAYSLQPDSWFCARRDSDIVALVGAYDYGPFACIGMMAVHPGVQRGGVGEQLLAHLLQALTSDVALLDATAAGQRLYPRLGFIAEGETLRMKRLQSSLPASERSGSAVAPLTEADVPAVVAFDAPIFGAERGPVLNDFRRSCPGRAFVARQADGGIVGFIMAGGNHIGPCSAATPEAAEHLLAAALALPYGAPPFMTCPADNTDAVRLLRRFGFVDTEHLLHMRRGGTSDPRHIASLYGQASLTLG